MATILQQVYDLGFRGPFVLDSTSILTPDGFTIIAAPGGGNFIRQGPVPGWNDITDVFVNTSTGDDNNDGLSSGTALATPYEAQLRLGSLPINASVQTIHIVGDYAGDLSLQPVVVNSGSLVVQGTRTIIVTGRTYTVSIVSAFNGATQTEGTYQLTDDLGGHPDLHALGWENGGAYLQVVGATTTYCVVGKNLGAGTFHATWFNELTFSNAEPPPGATVQAYRTNAITGMVAIDSVNSTGLVVLENLDLGSAQSLTVNGSQAQFFGCVGHVTVVNRAVDECDFFACSFTGSWKQFSAAVLVSCYAFSCNLETYTFATTNIQGNTIVQQAQVSVGNVSWGPGFMSLLFGSSLVVEDYASAGTALDILAGEFIAPAGYLFTVNSSGTPTNGIHINGGAALIYGGGFLPVVGTANGPTNPWNIGGQSFTQAAVASAANVRNSANDAMVALSNVSSPSTQATSVEQAPVDLVLHDISPSNTAITGNAAIVVSNVVVPALQTVNDQFTDPTFGRFTIISEGTPLVPGVGLTISGGHISFANTTGQNTGLQEGPDMTMCVFAASIQIVSLNLVAGNAYENPSVGWSKDANNFILAVWTPMDSPAHASIQVKIGGVFNFRGQVTVSWTPPFEIGITLVASGSLTFWQRPNGGQWTKVTSFDCTSTFNFKTQSLVGWKPTFFFASDSVHPCTCVFANFQAGSPSYVGFRDPYVVANEDGTPVISSDLVTLTATLTDPEAAAWCGVFTFNLVTRVLTHVGAITVNRLNIAGNPSNENDNACCIVHISGSNYHVLITTWGNVGEPGQAANNINILYKQVSSSPLSGAVILSGMTQLSLAGVPASGGSYDPSLVKIGSTYYLAWTAGPVAANSFYPVLNSSPDLTTWSLVGQDVNAFPYEGTRIIPLGGSYHVLTASNNNTFSYDLTMTFEGVMNSLVLTGGTAKPPHPMLVPDGQWTYQLTFDGTLYQSQANTNGRLRLFRARRYGVQS